MKAILYTLEAIFGAVLILVGIMFIYPTQQQTEISFSEVSYNCFKQLDQTGLLRNYATNSMITELNNSLRECLPPITDFKFKICETSDCVDISVPYDKPVYLSSYLIAGDTSYNRKLINLWVWSK
jgi:hypothetical protein